MEMQTSIVISWSDENKGAEGDYELQTYVLFSPNTDEKVKEIHGILPNTMLSDTYGKKGYRVLPHPNNYDRYYIFNEDQNGNRKEIAAAFTSHVLYAGGRYFEMKEIPSNK